MNTQSIVDMLSIIYESYDLYLDSEETITRIDRGKFFAKKYVNGC